MIHFVRISTGEVIPEPDLSPWQMSHVDFMLNEDGYIQMDLPDGAEFSDFVDGEFSVDRYRQRISQPIEG